MFGLSFPVLSCKPLTPKIAKEIKGRAAFQQNTETRNYFSSMMLRDDLRPCIARNWMCLGGKYEEHCNVRNTMIKYVPGAVVIFVF